MVKLLVYHCSEVFVSTRFLESHLQTEFSKKLSLSHEMAIDAVASFDDTKIIIVSSLAVQLFVYDCDM